MIMGYRRWLRRLKKSLKDQSSQPARLITEQLETRLLLSADSIVPGLTTSLWDGLAGSPDNGFSDKFQDLIDQDNNFDNYVPGLRLDDARGFRQWQEVGRHVKKGEHGFPILCPVTVKQTETDRETGETVERMALVGFRAQTVFGHIQTEGEPLPGDEHVTRFIEALPLLDVAKAWGLTVAAYSGKESKPLGWYRPKIFPSSSSRFAMLCACSANSLTRSVCLGSISSPCRIALCERSSDSVLLTVTW